VFRFPKEQHQITINKKKNQNNNLKKLGSPSPVRAVGCKPTLREFKSLPQLNLFLFLRKRKSFNGKRKKDLKD
jgi:hypothetical protein